MHEKRRTGLRIVVVMAAAMVANDPMRSVQRACCSTGGRIWTTHDWDGVVELGATFIHGVKGNPITHLANKFGVPLLHMDYDKIQLHDSDGSILSDKEFDDAKAIYDKLREGFFQLRDHFDRDEDLETSYNKVRKHGNLELDAKQERLLSWHFYWEIVQVLHQALHHEVACMMMEPHHQPSNASRPRPVLARASLHFA